MPRFPKHYRMAAEESEARFTIKPSPEFPIREFSAPPGGQSGVATILMAYGGVSNPEISESTSVEKNVAEATPTVSESVSAERNVAEATQTISESVEVTVT